MDDTITRHEFEAETKRLDAENDRQNRRIDNLEETVEEIHKLTAAVERLAVSVQSVAEGHREHRTRIEALESRGGKLLWKIAEYGLTAGVGFLLASLLRLAGIF